MEPPTTRRLANIAAEGLEKYECQYAHAGIDVTYGARNCYIIPIIPLSRCLLCACLRSMEIWHLQRAMGPAC